MATDYPSETSATDKALVMNKDTQKSMSGDVASLLKSYLSKKDDPADNDKRPAKRVKPTQ